MSGFAVAAAGAVERGGAPIVPRVHLRPAVQQDFDHLDPVARQISSSFKFVFLLEELVQSLCPNNPKSGS